MSAENQKIVRKRCTILLETKVKILDRLKKGEKLSVVAKTENLNEATIRTIRKNEKKIREHAAIVPLGVKRSFCSTNVNIMNTEKALSIWIEDCVNKRVPLSGNIIKQKALKIYNHLLEGQQTTTEQQSQSFCASKGWMERFKARYSLHNIRLQGESASVDVEAARQFRTELQNPILEESNSKSVTTGDTENYENVSNQNFSVDDVKYALHLANKLEMFLTKKDPCKERNRKFATQLNNCIKPYENYLDELQHRNEPSCSTATYSDEDEPSDVDIRPRKYPRIKTFLDDTSDED